MSSEKYQQGVAAEQQASEDHQTVLVSGDGSSKELEEKSTSKVLI